MDEKELLEEAKRRYPIGTEVISAHPDYGSDYMKVKDFRHSLQSDSEIYFNGDRTNNKYSTYNPCVYYRGKWALVTKYPHQRLLESLEIY